MSNLRQIDFGVIDDLVEFVNGRGYVLDFSDRTFAQFFASEFNIDIDDHVYRDDGNSKGRRFKSLLRKVDDALAGRILKSIWEHRNEFLYRTGRSDPIVNAEGRFLAVIARLEGVSPAQPAAPPKEAFDVRKFHQLRDQLVAVSSMVPQQRGFAFERFLMDAFRTFDIDSRKAFRNPGEQIDGSIVVDGHVYLLEAKWEQSLTDITDLAAFSGKLQTKADWTRGLFVSYCGFSDGALSAFGNARKVVCMDGLDINDALERQIPLNVLITRKARAASESGRSFVRARDLF